MKRLALIFALALAGRTVPADVFFSEDGGKTWTPAGLKGVFVTEIFPDPSDAKIAVAMIDDLQKMQRTEDGGKTWKEISTGIGIGPVAIDPANPKSLWVGGESGAFAHSTDAGVTWTKGSIGAAAGSEGGKVNNVGAMLVVGKRVYAGGGQGTGFAAFSDDDGATWTAIERKGGWSFVCAMAATKGAILIGGNLAVVASTDGGKTWKTSPGIEERMGTDGHFSVNPDGLRVTFSYSGEFLASSDGGLTFAPAAAPTRSFPSSAAWADGKMIVVAQSGKCQGKGMSRYFQPDDDVRNALYESEDAKTWKRLAASPPREPWMIVGACDGKGLWLGTR